MSVQSRSHGRSNQNVTGSNGGGHVSSANFVLGGDSNSFHHKDQQIKKLMEENTKLRAANATLRKRDVEVSSVASFKEQLTTLTKSHADRLEQLKMQNQDLVKAKSDFEKENTVLKIQVGQLTEKNQDLLEKSIAQNILFFEETKELEESKKKAIQEKLDLQAEMANRITVEHFRELQDKLALKIKQNEELEEKIASMENMEKNLLAKISALDMSLEQSEKRRTEFKLEMGGKNTELLNELIAAQEENRELREQLDHEKTTVHLERMKFRAEIEEWEKKVDGLEVEKNQLKSDIEEKEISNAHLKSELDSLGTILGEQLQTLETSRNTMESERNAAQHSLEKCKRESNELTKTLDAAKIAMNRLQSDFDGFRAQQKDWLASRLSELSSSFVATPSPSTTFLTPQSTPTPAVPNGPSTSTPIGPTPRGRPSKRNAPATEPKSELKRMKSRK